MSSALVRGFLASCAVTIVLLGACGGRDGLLDPVGVIGGSNGGMAGSVGGGTGAGGNIAGSSGSGGSGVAGSGGSGVSGSGGSGLAGSGGSGAGSGSGGSGGGPCSSAACISAPCATGYRLTYTTDRCCPTCQKVLCTAPASCDLVSCPSGTHRETQLDSCCSSCVPDPDSSCDMNRRLYLEQRNQILKMLGSVRCAADSDCAVVREPPQCVASCGTAIPASVQPVWSQFARAIYANACASCPILPSVPCHDFTVAQCVAGQCTMVVPL